MWRSFPRWAALGFALSVGCADAQELDEPILPLPLTIELDPGRVALGEKLFNAPRLAREVLPRWVQFQPARRVEIHIVDGLQAQGDGPLVAIVLENLLGNAWKYSAKNPQARIEFAAEQRANQTVFYVRDNGAGFDMKYAGKLFGVFQRLHRTEDFDGTGVGLATVANIINRHGGQVWADSAPNQGATFYFTLSSPDAT